MNYEPQSCDALHAPQAYISLSNYSGSGTCVCSDASDLCGEARANMACTSKTDICIVVTMLQLIYKLMHCMKLPAGRHFPGIQAATTYICTCVEREQ